MLRSQLAEGAFATGRGAVGAQTRQAAAQRRSPVIRS
jgi:hypothetical protein